MVKKAINFKAQIFHFLVLYYQKSSISLLPTSAINYTERF